MSGNQRSKLQGTQVSFKMAPKAMLKDRKTADLRAGFFKDDPIERATILDFVHFLKSNY